jgi:hypothetical protein
VAYVASYQLSALGALLVTFTFLSLVHRFNLSGTLAIYAALSAAGFVYVWLCVPGTRGRTLEEIQRALEK